MKWGGMRVDLHRDRLAREGGRREGRKQGGTPGRAGPGSLAPGVARQAGEEEVLRRGGWGGAC